MLSCQRASVPPQEREIAIVLQAFLEIVAGEQVIEVTRLRARPALRASCQNQP